MGNKISIVENSSLAVKNRFDLILLVLDERKAAWLGNSKVVEGRKQKVDFVRKFRSELEEIKKTLNQLGLFYDSSELQVEEHEEDIATVSSEVSVTKSEKYLTEFVEANRRDLDRKIGLLLGYPQTAVEAFEADEHLTFQLFFQELPREKRKKLKEEGVLNFLQFQPSEQHWREELEEVRRIQNSVRKESSTIYEEVVSSEINFGYLPASRLEEFWAWLDNLVRT